MFSFLNFWHVRYSSNSKTECQSMPTECESVRLKFSTVCFFPILLECVYVLLLYEHWTATQFLSVYLNGWSGTCKLGNSLVQGRRRHERTVIEICNWRKSNVCVHKSCVLCIWFGFSAIWLVDWLVDWLTVYAINMLFVFNGRIGSVLAVNRPFASAHYFP